MFENKSAWFSSSCPEKVSQIWVQNGGKLESVDTAKFVFSDSWTHSDTKQLCNSKEYLNQSLAIFSSQYVIDAATQGVKHVSLGKYFLVPPEIRESLDKRQFRSVEVVDKPPNVATSLRSPEVRLTRLSPEHEGETRPAMLHNSETASCSRRPVQEDLDAIPHVQSLPKVIGYLRCIYPGKEGVTVSYAHR